MTTVLVVDDEEDIRVLNRYLLGRAGYTVLEAASGDEAFALLETEAVDLIILDVRMAGMTGYEVLDELGRRGVFPRIPVVAASAHAEREVLDEMMARGCTGYVVKPFEPHELLAAIRASAPQC